VTYEAPHLARIVDEHRPVNLWGLGCTGCKWYGDLHCEHVEELWRDARRIDNVSTLIELPAGATIRTKTGHTYEKLDDGQWYTTASCLAVTANLTMLPAVLIDHPEWSDQ
jgi:hypothetical protein